MKITFVLPGIGLSGGSRVVFEYSNRLTRRGHEVSIVYPLLPISVKYRFTWQELKRNIGALKSLRCDKGVSWFNLSARLIRVPLLEPWAMNLVEPYIPKADAVIATAWETAYAVNMLKPDKGKKFYFIQNYEIWGCWDDDSCWADVEAIEKNPSRWNVAMADVTPRDPTLKAYKMMVDRTFKFPMRKIVISSWLKQLIEEKFGEITAGPIINGINTDVFYPDPPENRGTKLRVLMPYRPYKNKGTSDGFKALQLVRQRFPDIEYVFFGEKRPTSLPEWALFYQSPSDEELRRLYSSADVFVSPSWVEGCQLPPMEASACGCAVVATNVGGVPDYGIDGETLISLPPRRPELLARGIIGLLENPYKRKDIARRGKEHIAQFTWDKATDELECILEEG